MYKILKMRMVQSLIVLTLFLVGVGTVWSEPELLLTLEGWKFKVQPGNYLVRFTVELSNDYERPIKGIDAFLYFEDELGIDLEKVYVNPSFKIPPGKSEENTWTYVMNPFSPMLTMKPDNIRVRLVVREITFSSGERVPFTIASGVIY